VNPEDPYGDEYSGSDYSDLDALDIYRPLVESSDAEPDWSGRQPTGEPENRPQTLLFSAESRDGSVVVTATFSGHLRDVELSARVGSMSESELAGEIVRLAQLAQHRAQAGQHAIITELFGRMGHDRVAISGWLEHELGLPSPESVQAEAAQIFAITDFDDRE
jgi:hypothetical protein